MISLSRSLSLSVAAFEVAAYAFRTRKPSWSSGRSLQPKTLVVHSFVNRRASRMWRSLWAWSRRRNRSVFFFAEERTFYKNITTTIINIIALCILLYILCVRVNICIWAFCYFRHRFRLIFAVCSKLTSFVAFVCSLFKCIFRSVHFGSVRSGSLTNNYYWAALKLPLCVLLYKKCAAAANKFHFKCKLVKC